MNKVEVNSSNKKFLFSTLNFFNKKYSIIPFNNIVV